MFILEASMCENASFLSTVYYIKNIIFIISIMIPIVLVVLLTLDLARAVVAGDENRMKEAQNHAIKRILYSVIIIVVPIVVNAVFTTLGKGGVDGLDCYNNATKEKIVKLEKKQQKDDEQYQAKQQEEIDVAIEKKNARDKELEEIITKARESINSPTANVSKDIYHTKNLNGSEAIAITAEALAWPYGTPKKNYKYNYGKEKFTSWSELGVARPTQAFMNAFDSVCKNHFSWPAYHGSVYIGGARVGASCDKFVAVVVRYSGYDKDFPTGVAKADTYLASHNSKWKKVTSGTPKRGDICIKPTHIKIYLGDGMVAEASINSKFGYIHEGNCNGFTVYRANK